MASYGRLWYTAVPRPEGMMAEIDRRLDLQAAGSMLPFTVLDSNGTAVGMTTFMNIDAVHRRVRDRIDLVRQASSTNGIEHRMQANADDPRIRDARLHRRRVPNFVLQSTKSTSH